MKAVEMMINIILSDGDLRPIATRPEGIRSFHNSQLPDLLHPARERIALAEVSQRIA